MNPTSLLAPARLLPLLALLLLQPGHAQTTKALDITTVIEDQTGPAARCPSNFGSTITGRGTGAIFGTVVLMAIDCVAPQGPLFVFSAGKIVIVTAAGHQLFANYSGQMVPTGIGYNYVLSGATFQITGGLGAFAKATGGGTLQGSENLATGVGQLKILGKVTY